MSVIFIALPVALLMGAAAVWAFVRSVAEGQFDDLETPPHRMLYDDVQLSAGKPPRRAAGRSSDQHAPNEP